MNYNNEPEMFKKGSVIFREVRQALFLSGTVFLTGFQYELVEPGVQSSTQEVDDMAEPAQQSKSQTEKDKKKRAKAEIAVQHLDIIKDDFWDRRPWLLSNKPGKFPKEP